MLIAAAAAYASPDVIKCTGQVVDANSTPLIGVMIIPDGESRGVTSDIDGYFVINAPSEKPLLISFAGYKPVYVKSAEDLGVIRLTSDDASDDYFGESSDLIIDDATFEDEEGSSQSVAALNGANDDIYYSTASYNFSPMYFRYRGYDSQYQTVYINGMEFNDLIRGRFNFSTLLGMTSRAFRNKTTTVGMGAAAYGFGSVGGSVNYNTVTDTYAPGFNGSLAYTNSSYMMRAMATYSTGVNRHGWAFTVSAIGRYAPEGVIEGTFYNSGGLFLSLEKVFNPNNSLTFTAFGGPTQRATAIATYQ